MAIELKTKDGESTPEVSRILVRRDVATVFRKLCKLSEKNSDDLLEEMMRRYIKSEKLKVEIIKRENG